MPKRAPKVNHLVWYFKGSGDPVKAQVSSVTTPGSTTSTVGIRVTGDGTFAAVARQTARGQSGVWNHAMNGYL